MSYRNGKPRITFQGMRNGISVLISIGDTNSLNSRELYHGISKKEAYLSAINYALNCDLEEIELYPQSIVLTLEEESFLERQSEGRLRVVYHA